LYKNQKEKEYIIRDITERLEGLKENELPENSEEEIGPWIGFEAEWVGGKERTGTVRKE